MKKFLIALVIVVTLLSFNLAAIGQINVTLTYTADNQITGFWHKEGATVINPVSLGTGANWWPTADSYTTTIAHDLLNQFIWEVQNWGAVPGLINPGAFLAQVTTTSELDPPSSNPLSDYTWKIWVSYGGQVSPDRFRYLSWRTPTEYGANNDPSTIWNQVIRGPVAGIDGAAQWIWGPRNYPNPLAPGPNDYVYIKVNINSAPEPGTLLLLGSGLLGLGIVARLRRKKS